MNKKEFIDSLLKEMTLREKIGQMYQTINDGGVITGPQFKKSNFFSDLKKGEIGSVLGIYDNDTLREIQRIATEETRMKIPVMNCCDIIHGCRTILPINLGMSCTWNEKLLEKANEMVAYESVNSGVDLTFAPMLDLARDPRWGRVAEGNGEDPYLSKRLTKALVKGFKKGGLASCAKHYVGYGHALGGRDYDSVDMSISTLFEYYLPPFREAIKSGVDMVMNSFNVFNGIPVGANKYLLTHVLRKKLGFKGVVISDWASCEELLEHKVAKDHEEVAQKSLDAGVDIEMYSRNYIDYLEKVVNEGKVDIKKIDSAARRILELKYDIGLFDNPYKNIKNNPYEYFLKKESKDIALKVSEEAICLLENDGTLPLNKKQNVAFVGPYLENGEVVGCWGGKVDFKETVTLMDALKKRDIKYQACNLKNIFEYQEEEKKNVLEISKTCDIIVYTMGEEQEMSGESHSRSSLDVIKCHDELLDELLKLNKKIVLVVYAGRPLVLTKYKKLFEEGKISAILYTWFLGTMSGEAIVNTLYGINNPSGKLTMSFPYSVGEVPVYYNRLPSGRPHLKDQDNNYRLRYIDGPIEALYPFGYGLSYSKFIYHDFTIDQDEIPYNGKLKVTVDIENDSKKSGYEVIEAYISAPAGKLSRPVKELKGFKKVFIKAHERRSIDIIIDGKDLMYYDDEKPIPYYGKYKLYVGGSSDESRYKEFCIKLNTYKK